jgi:hypothetical protein
MKTFFLIDGGDGNKVVREFDSEEDAWEWVDYKETTENWEEDYASFEDFKDEFFLVDSCEMKEAVRKYGSRKENYWT